MIHTFSLVRSESLFIECNDCIKIEYCNSTLSCPSTEGTMNKLPPPLTYLIYTYLLF